MKGNKLCFKLGVASFIIGFLFILINLYWIPYGILFILLGILDMCLYKKSAYLRIAGMLYVVMDLFALVGIFSYVPMLVPFAVCLAYAIVFLKVGFSSSDI